MLTTSEQSSQKMFQIFEHDIVFDERNTEFFSVCSWNTLYKQWVMKEDYPTIEDEHRTWEFRLPRLRQKMSDINADILCLQEIDKSTFKEDFGDYLKKTGNYEWNVNLTKKNKIMMSNAIAWKKNKFKLIWHEWRSRTMMMLFQHLSEKTKRECPQQMKTDNNDLGANQENSEAKKNKDEKKTKKNQKNAKESLQLSEKYEYLLVCNCHLEGKPSKHDIRFSQMKSLLQRLDLLFHEQNFPKEKIPVIICGDFNSTCDEVVVQMLLNRKVDPNHSALLESDDRNFVHLYYFREGYDEVFKKNRHITFAANGILSSIDFIFYTDNNLLLCGVKKTLPDNIRPTRDNLLLLPNARFPSDHLPIAALFQFPSVQPLSQTKLPQNNHVDGKWYPMSTF
ncbi:hypothetical protein RFI_26582 [Reticulomyxa filosa]|uniref:Endonuclease/exonuclease/phosphatase domain-containing protein n=1 Tax=Reticulomyxa filosa TaxID=46433 RepID=X6MCM6_RETFI|nr:hypothetical protein RFI_26582 [Reticulomyxa filosa]|eukprot:ETO10795.1 hypothetical protein RFI_26582 [Reticulomyxa filosa]